MKRFMSALLMSLAIPAVLQAQDIPARFSRSNSRDSLAARFTPQIDTRRYVADTTLERTRHAVRNGAIAGAVVGAVSGAYAASLLGFGCKTYLLASGEAPPCHASRDSFVAVTLGTVIGGAAFGLVGAGAGKIWQWLN